MRACHNWHVAGVSQPPLELNIRTTPAAVAALVASPIRRHLTGVSFDSNATLQLKQLRLLCALPRLTALDAALDLRARLQGDSRKGVRSCFGTRCRRNCAS